MSTHVYSKFAQKADSTSAAKRALLQRPHSSLPFSIQRVLQLQRTAGNQALQRALATMARPALVGPEGGDVSGEVQRGIDQARGGGQPMDKHAGAKIGGMLGADFSGVRVHTDARAQSINRSLGAEAATVGNNIFFSKNAYNPSSVQGRRLLTHELTHELTHVVQQGGHAGNTVRPKLRVGPANDAHEQEAERVSAGVAERPVTSTGRPSIQRMMSYATYEKRLGKKYDLDLVTSKGMKAKDEQYYAAQIDEAFKVYEADTDNMGNLARLHHTITAWQTFKFEHINAKGKGRKEAEVANTLAMNSILKALLKEIKAELKKKSAKQAAKQGGYVQTLDEMLTEGADKMTFDDLSNVDMPKEFVKVGISPTYYEKNIKGKGAELILKFAYRSLERGDLEKAIHELNHKELLALPGYPMIRSLLLSHFSNSTRLKGLLNMKSSKGDLTDDELNALQIYTGNSDLANSAMRGASDLKDENIDAAMQYKLVISALSKLPKFKGVAYRGFTPFSGVDKAYQVGATVADLAFTSAAGSFAGVDHYLKYAPQEGAKGTQNYFSVIRSKSAVHVSNKANSSRENEVLFKPGSRFKVKGVWRHSADGKVPMNAPTEAQMILQRVGQFTAVHDGKGYGKQDWDDLRKRQMTSKTNPKDIGAFQGQAKVKVFEMAEL
jgi:hypothetical protein